MQQQTEDLHTCARCASPHPRAWCYPHRRGTTIKVHKVKIGVWTFSTKQTEREWRRQWADAVATTADLAGVHAPPHVVLTAARILRDRDRLAEASRARGREKTNRKCAERAARFEAEIADRLARGESLGPIVQRHRKARAHAREEWHRRQLEGDDTDGVKERNAVEAAGLSKSTIYAIASRLKKIVRAV